MFSSALSQVEKYTLPFVMSRRLFNGQIGSSCGSFIVVNPQDWILTAAHIAKEVATPGAHKPQIEAYEKQRDAIVNSPNLNDKAKHKQLKLLKPNQIGRA